MLSIRLRLFVAFFFSFICAFSVPSVLAAAPNSKENDRDVRVGIIEGDVRLSRGNHERSDLKRPWEGAIMGEPLSQGFALATGDGRASIDFEDGSTVYVAENSLLLLNEISSNLESNFSSVTLVTGAATFELKPQAGNRFLVVTPTEKLFVSAPEEFHARINAYLDAAAITPRGERGEVLRRAGLGRVRFQKGETFYLSDGCVVSDRYVVESPLESISVTQPPSQPADRLCSGETSWIFARQSFSEIFCSDPLLTRSVGQPSTVQSAPELNSQGHQTFSDFNGWDIWVSDRVKEKNTLTAAALKASGLSSPVPGLVELYQHGAFFQCAPYGTCWEPEESESNRQSAAAAPAQNPTVGGSANQGFQPVTVEVYEPRYALCGLDQWSLAAHVANTPAELQRLQLLKARAETERSRNALFSREGCFQHEYVVHQNRYARLVNSTAHCDPRHMDCKKHPPFPHVTTVRVNGRVGFVPRHPDDKKGKPPINLKNGILFPPEKPGQSPQRVSFPPSQKLKFENKNETELRRELAPKPLAASAPEIHAHFMSDSVRGWSASSVSANSSGHQIAYDYKSQKFVMSTPSAGERHEKPVAVAGLSGGRISGSGGTSSNHSVGGFERSNGSSGRGSGYSGGSGGHYSGSSSYGSHSSSSNSSSSGSSHSYGAESGGGRSSSSSSSSGGSSSSSPSSSSSAGAGGRPH